ncbi:MAG: MFS transporter [Myxococcota bacterium]
MTDASSEPQSLLNGRTVALYLTGFAALVGLYLPQPILPLLARDFGVDAQRASLLVSVAILGIAVGSPVIGVLSDRFGRRRLLVLGASLLSGVSAMCALAPSFELFVALRFVLGLVLPTLLVVAVAAVSDALPATRMRTVTGLYVAANVLGGMVGRVLGGAFAEHLDWRYGFALSAVLYLILVPLWARLPAPGTLDPERTMLGVLRGTLGHLRNPATAGGIMVAFFLFFAFQATFTYLPFRLEAPPFLFSSTVIALVYLTYVAGMASSSLAGWFRARLGLRTGLVLGFVLTIVGNALTLTFGVSLLVVGLLVLCFGNWMVHGLALGYVATVAPNDRAGANALYLLLYYLGGSLGAYLPGFIFASLGYPGVIGASVAALAAGMAISARLRTSRGAMHVPAAGRADA